MPWSGIGGVEIATLRMTDIMRERIRYVAFCLPGAVEVRDAFEKLGIETIEYVAPQPSALHAAQYYRDSLVISAKLREEKVDIVHFAEVNAAYHNSLAGYLAGAKLVCHSRVSAPYLPLREKLSLLPVHSFIFVSKEARKTFAVSVPKNKASVVYDAFEAPSANALDSPASLRKELGIPEGNPVIGMVARVNPQKDYFTLAAAAAKVLRTHPEARFLIVGDNSRVEMNRHHYLEVVSRLSELGIADAFVFAGHRDDAIRLIPAMDFCVLCTHREGFPLSILEAMSLHKPVIATDVGGISEIVVPGVTGYLHPHQDSDALADAILTLIEDPAKTLQLGQIAYETVRDNYSRAKYADEMIKVYQEALLR
jgi:glycosyltransferase involved in cell wall biosynthesis